MGGDIKPIKDMADMAEDVQTEELWRMVGQGIIQQDLQTRFKFTIQLSVDMIPTS